MPKVKCCDCKNIRPLHKGEAMQDGQCPILNQLRGKRVVLRIHRPKRCKYFREGKSKFYFPDNPQHRRREGLYGE